jgi:hypothetical protein
LPSHSTQKQKIISKDLETDKTLTFTSAAQKRRYMLQKKALHTIPHIYYLKKFGFQHYVLQDP